MGVAGTLAHRMCAREPTGMYLRRSRQSPFAGAPERPTRCRCQRMEYRNLGRTGVKVSQLCLGAMMFGRSTNEQDSVAIIQHALGAGINFIDTANAYSAGASERFLGKALAGGKRTNVVLATKAFFPLDTKDP